jgi:hypothetical protein
MDDKISKIEKNCPKLERKRTFKKDDFERGLINGLHILRCNKIKGSPMVLNKFQLYAVIIMEKLGMCIVSSCTSQTVSGKIGSMTTICLYFLSSI